MLADDSLPPEVLAALQRGDKIGAIKLLRVRNGLGLAEAKAAFERMHASEKLRDAPAPGAVSANGKSAWPIVAVLVALVVLLLVFRRT